MTCAEVRARLDAYARDALSPDEAMAFERHLQSCAECGGMLADGATSPDGIAGLPRSLEPRTDLWPAIAARLAPRSGVRRGRVVLPGWLLAAAAVVLVSISSGVTVAVLRHGSATRAAPEPGRLGAIEAEYAAAAADLTRTLEQARGRLAPATAATIERNLATIDGALDEARGALLRDPGNTALQQLVVAAWKQKVDLLRRAASLSTES